MITLTTKRLRVEISGSGEAPNNGFRFDRAGFITDVVLDGSVHFCGSEPQNLPHPSSGGRGLCNEYRFDISEQVRVGEYFPKFGVGLIRKEADEPFLIYRKYKDVRFFPIHTSAQEGKVIFETEALPCCGYALTAEKTIEVIDNHIKMSVSVKNVGVKKVEISEFCHNFLSIDGMAIGPDYILEYPQIRDQGTEKKANRHGVIGNIRGYGKGYTFSAYSPAPSGISVDLEGAELSDGLLWRLDNRGAKAWVEGRDEFVPEKGNIWSADHIVSPETFYLIKLEPGEETRWTRRWTFEKEW